MNIAIVGRAKHEILDEVRALGFAIDDKEPEYVLSYGGDGTLMIAEHQYPGIPKLLLKNSAVCKKCSALPNSVVLERFVAGDFEIEEIWKLEAETGGKKLLGINDIVARNKDPRHAMRYRLWVDEDEISRVIIGDGAVLATPFGSTAYYRSITKSFFNVGIGIAFNNSTEPFDHMVVPETSRIRIKIERGPVMVYADNQPEAMELGEGDEITIHKSDQSAKIIRFS